MARSVLARAVLHQPHVDRYPTSPTPLLRCSGESGAGKTETSKHVVRQIIELCRAGNNELEDKLLVVNPLLEAFGNAKTGASLARTLQVALRPTYNHLILAPPLRNSPSSPPAPQA